MKINRDESIAPSSLRSFLSSPYRSAKHTTYFQVYDLLFEKYVGKKLTFLEIGVLDGGSLFMWRDFFGPQARIIGIDLNPEAIKWANFGFEIYIGDQNDPEFWNQLKQDVPTIDIALDDGGHTYLQQISTVENLIPCISDGGLLVVEDTHTSYMPGFGNQKYSFIRFIQKVVDRVNYRFGALEKADSDISVFNVQIFESIVALHIDRAKAQRSHPVENNAESAGALDFRNHQSPEKELLQKLKLFRSLDFSSIKLAHWATMKLEARGILSGFKLRKYFK